MELMFTVSSFWWSLYKYLYFSASVQDNKKSIDFMLFDSAFSVSDLFMQVKMVLFHSICVKWHVKNGIIFILRNLSM